MSNADLYREFEDFGNKMKTIAILTAIGLIASLVGLIAFIGSLISLVMSIIIIIFFLLVIGDIKKVGRMLDNNKDLLGFPLKFILGTIIRLIGLGFWEIGLMLLLYTLFSGQGTIALLAISITLMPIGAGLIIVGSILRLLAWGGLKNFFSANTQLFPTNIGDEARSGANLCKIGCILDMVFLSTIGDILRIIGYFKLASLKRLTGAPTQPMPQPEMPMQAPVEAPSVNYCPNCGSDISMGARFCPSCGAEIE